MTFAPSFVIYFFFSPSLSSLSLSCGKQNKWKEKHFFFFFFFFSPSL